MVKSSNVWISADKFGVCLNAGVLQVFPPERLTGYSFLPDLEAQAVDETPLTTTTMTPSPTPAPAQTQPAVPQAVAEESTGGDEENR